MSMTPLQREAMARAQRGDWRLADAMELDARAGETFDLNQVEELPLSHGITANGRLRFLVYADPEYVGCGECDGEGEVECNECGHTRDCTHCDDGLVLSAEGFGASVTTDLNGVVVDRSDDPECAGHVAGKTMDIAEARQILKDYQKSLTELPKPAPLAAGNPTQTPLIPENFQCA